MSKARKYTKNNANDNVFLAEFLTQSKNKIPPQYDDEILTKFFDLGYEEQDMTIDKVVDFVLSLGVQEVLLDKYFETLVHNHQQPLEELTSILTISGLEEDGIVDFEKLGVFVYKFLVLRDNFELICDFWKVLLTYLENARKKEIQKGNDVEEKPKRSDFDQEIAYPDLKLIVKSLKLDDKIDNGTIIDMVANGSDNARPFVNFYDFAVLLGKVGEIHPVGS